MAAQEERRRSTRKACSWPVNIIVDGDMVSGETVDVSVHGVHVHCDDPLPMNEAVTLTIAPPERDLIKARAKVIWSDLEGIDTDNRPVAMGLCFVEIEAEDQQVFEAAICEDED